MTDTTACTKRGELRKRSAHLGVYRRHMVLLTSVGMQFYKVDGGEDKPLTIVPITTETKVSPITEDMVRGNYGTAHPDQFLFYVTTGEPVGGDKNNNAALYRPRIYTAASENIYLSAASKQEAETWKQAVEDRVAMLHKGLASISDLVANGGEKKAKKVVSLQLVPGYDAKDAKVKAFRERMKRQASVGGLAKHATLVTAINLVSKAMWEEVKVTNGLRVLAEVSLAKMNPCLRISCILPASPERAFRLLNNLEKRSVWDSVTESVDVIKDEGDGHTRTLHYKLRGQYVNGYWTSPRDYVVDSTWRRESNGSFVVLESEHTDTEVPPCKGYVRAEMYNLGITICPRRTGTQRDDMAVDDEEEEHEEDEGSFDTVQDCMLQMAVHASPGGWVSKLPLDWGREWLCAFMLRVVGLRCALEEDNYETVDFHAITGKSKNSSVESLKIASSAGATIVPSSSIGSTMTASGKDLKVMVVPEMTSSLANNHWRQCPEPFKLRSATYLTKKVKEASGEPKFELIAVDLFEVETPMDNVAQSFKGGVGEKYLTSPGPVPFLFVIQFQVPGPPHYSFVFYFAAKHGAIESLSPFSRLFQDFVDGTDDFRDSRFKMIPRVVNGSFVVKSAVGQTPAILGKKLVQSYYRGDNYFELDVDVGSSSVAGNILKVVKSFARNLTIDMAFLLESQSEDELPEALLGCIQFNDVDLSKAKKYVAQ